MPRRDALTPIQPAWRLSGAGVVVAVVSGGNVDPERYNRLLAGGS